MTERNLPGAEAPTLSIVVPVYNEESNLEPLAAELVRVLEGASLTYEIVFVNDGSRDRSLQIMRALAATNPAIRYASFSRNFGHEAATSCGFQLVRGQAAILMDADFQDPPSLIPQMVAKWREGYEVVCARRRERAGESAFKKSTAKLFYRLLNRLSDVDIPLDVGDFRLVDRKAIDAFNRFTERNRFVRGLFSWTGFRQTIIDYDRLARRAGETKYNTLKLLLLSIDAIFSYSLVPLRLCLLLGALVTAFSLAMAGVIVFQRLVHTLEIPGYALLATGMFFLGGVGLLCLGVIGEYVGKIYLEVQGRPLYIVDETSPLPVAAAAAVAGNSQSAGAYQVFLDRTA